MTKLRRFSFCSVGLVALAVSCATAACANETLKGSSVANAGKGAGAQAVIPPKKTILPSVTATKPGVVVKAPTGESYVAPGIANSRRKSLPLLRASIVTCLGADESAFEVKPEMMAD